MRNRRILGLLLATSLLLACNFPLFARSPQLGDETATAPVLVLPTETPTVAALPSFTPIPLASATATIVATPSVPTITPNAVNVNCRYGPDVAYDAVGVLVFGSSAQVLGRTEDSAWWYIHNPTNPSAFCWVSSGVVSIAGPTGGIPVVPLPAAIVTKVTVAVDVPSTIACGGPNPVEFNGAITTNGAATVKYQWEITGDKTNTTSPETLTFSGAGTQNPPSPGAYSVDCGNFKITLHVLSPNDISASKDFKVAAP